MIIKTPEQAKAFMKTSKPQEKILKLIRGIPQKKAHSAKNAP